jgi:hypothetical protein
MADSIRAGSELVLLPTDDVGNPEKPCALVLEYKEDGDAVVLNASFRFGVCDMHNSRQLLKNDTEKQLGSYSARLNESFTLEEMKTFGFQPYKIKVVEAQVPHPSGPPTLSKVSLLEIEIVGEDRQFYKLMIHNKSAQAVTGLVVARSTPSSREQSILFDGQKPTLAGGADRELQFSNQKVNCASSEAKVSDVAQCPIVLEGALFADGTIGGDPSVVATMEARLLVSKRLQRQVDELLHNVLADSSLADAGKLAQLRSELPKLAQNTDQVALERLRSRYSDLPESAWTEVLRSMSVSSHMAENNVLNSLNEFEACNSEALCPETLDQWLSHSGIAH